MTEFRHAPWYNMRVNHNYIFILSCVSLISVELCISSRYAHFCCQSCYLLLFQPLHILVAAVEVVEWAANTVVVEEDWALCWWLDSLRKCWESTSIITTAGTIIITVIITVIIISWWEDENETFPEEELSVNSSIVEDKKVEVYERHKHQKLLMLVTDADKLQINWN